MTSSHTESGASESLSDVGSAEGWNDHVRRGSGHLLQSWQWGEFKRLHGWDAERIVVADGDRSAVAQALFRQVGPFSIGYVPRGPVVPDGNLAIARELFRAVDRVAQERGALHLIVEPDGPLPFTGTFMQEGFVRGPAHIQPSRTVKVPLGSDDELLGQMHGKTRYNVRVAQRRGVEVELPGSTPEAVARFFELMVDTSRRNDFGIHGLSYYYDFLTIFGEGALLLFAHVNGHLAAGMISAKFGSEGIYMYGGSSTAHRAHGAAFLLQYEAMRWARDAGCHHYDLWGIPPTDPDRTPIDGDRVAGTRGQDWRGLYRFKTGFGGEIVSYPATLERRYRPLLSFIARRRYGRYD